MSALTSSPSPAASPRSSFHIQHRSSHNASSPAISLSAGPSPKTRWPSIGPSSPSPRRAFHAPPWPASSSSGAGPSVPKAQPQHQEESLTEASARYVDAGTQYSPDGDPPTSRRPHASARAGKAQQRLAEAGETPSPASKKRKQLDSPEPMSTSGPSPAASSARDPPPEPEPRRDPSVPSSGAVRTATSSDRPEASEPEAARSTDARLSPSKRAKAQPSTAKVMPLLYQTCNPKELGHLISNMLVELIRLNDRIPLRDGRLTRFHSRAPPGISVSDYLQRLIHHATLSPPILLSMVYYIDRLCQLYPIFTINSLTVHRFLITAATVAAKGLSDAFWTNPTYARIGGVPVSELATLELEFLEKVQWKIVPKPEVLEDYYRSLVGRTEGYVLEGHEESELEDSSRSTSLGGSDEGAENEGEKGEDEEMVDEPS